MQWAGHLEDAVPAAHDTLREDESSLVGAHVLSRVPFLRGEGKQEETQQRDMNTSKALCLKLNVGIG